MATPAAGLVAEIHSRTTWNPLATTPRQKRRACPPLDWAALSEGFSVGCLRIAALFVGGVSGADRPRFRLGFIAAGRPLLHGQPVWEANTSGPRARQTSTGSHTVRSAGEIDPERSERVVGGGARSAETAVCRLAHEDYEHRPTPAAAGAVALNRFFRKPSENVASGRLAVAAGAQHPQCTFTCMRIASTTGRRQPAAQ